MKGKGLNAGETNNEVSYFSHRRAPQAVHSNICWFCDLLGRTSSTLSFRCASPITKRVVRLGCFLNWDYIFYIFEAYICLFECNYVIDRDYFFGNENFLILIDYILELTFEVFLSIGGWKALIYVACGYGMDTTGLNISIKEEFKSQ